MRKLSSCLRFDSNINLLIFSPKLFQVECSQNFWVSWACVTMHQLEGEYRDIGLIIKYSLL